MIPQGGHSFPLLPGPLVGRAALYTAGVVGGLTLTAACAPSEKYLHMSGPLSLGLGVVLVASIGQYIGSSQDTKRLLNTTVAACTSHS